MLTVAFGESTMNRTQVQLRYKRFKKGREDVNDNARQQAMKTLKQSPIISIEAFKRAKIEKSSSSWVKCKGFAHCFLRFAWRCSIMKSCHKVVRSIINTTLKLCTN